MAFMDFSHQITEVSAKLYHRQGLNSPNLTILRGKLIRNTRNISITALTASRRQGYQNLFPAMSRAAVTCLYPVSCKHFNTSNHCILGRTSLTCRSSKQIQTQKTVTSLNTRRNNSWRRKWFLTAPSDVITSSGLKAWRTSLLPQDLQRWAGRGILRVRHFLLFPSPRSLTHFEVRQPGAE